MTDSSLHAAIRATVANLRPSDELGAAHREAALGWLASTADIYRRAKPRTPSPHLVAYFLLVDRDRREVLLGDHRGSGLWLPPGGHVEPEEDPVDTVRREIMEELGIQAAFDQIYDTQPFFLTVTETVGPPSTRHTDVSLWFALRGDERQQLSPDPREFRSVAWWSLGEIVEQDPSRFEPELRRALTTLGL